MAFPREGQLVFRKMDATLGVLFDLPAMFGKCRRDTEMALVGTKCDSQFKNLLGYVLQSFNYIYAIV